MCPHKACDLKCLTEKIPLLNFLQALARQGGSAYAEDRFDYRITVDRYLPGVDVFAMDGKYLLYLCVVGCRASRSRSVPDPRENQ